MNILYIGQYSTGTTSKMRADILIDLIPGCSSEIIDIHIPFFQTNRLWRSFGFRFKRGPLIKKINDYILKNYNQEKYDLIWIDKGIFITSKTLKILRLKTNKLIHFTPDPAFLYHGSSHFRRSVKLYDYLITTKQFELAHYEKRVPREKIILTTQGFDPKLHKPHHSFSEKKNEVIFIGHFEKERGETVKVLIENNIKVTVAGNDWDVFCNKHKQNTNIAYLGNSVYGEDYSKTISAYYFSLGFLSKWIPETHTTRTFEIPACGTALLTERNNETQVFFNETEVLFYADTSELIEKITYYQNNTEKLKILSELGALKVNNDGYDYKNILKKTLKIILTN